MRISLQGVPFATDARFGCCCLSAEIEPSVSPAGAPNEKRHALAASSILHQKFVGVAMILYARLTSIEAFAHTH
jgi:hypothetical protein